MWGASGADSHSPGDLRTSGNDVTLGWQAEARYPHMPACYLPVVSLGRPDINSTLPSMAMLADEVEE